jgi:outer membrane immunogenic protein
MKLFTIAALAAALVTTPALSRTNENFTGVRAEVTAGVNDVTNSPDVNDVVYGAAIGVDVPVSDRFTFGVEANTSNVFEDERQIGASMRIGYALNKQFLGYVKGGYNNYNNVFSQKLDGATAGAGVEFSISDNSYVKAEYNYTDFQANTGSHAALIGVGLRF